MARAGHHTLLIEIQRPIAFALIEGMLGSSPDGLYSPRRPLTEIEQRLISHFVDDFIAQLNSLWNEQAADVPTEFQLDRIECCPDRVTHDMQNESAYVANIRLRWSAVQGLLRVVYASSFVTSRIESASSSVEGEPGALLKQSANDSHEAEIVAVLAQRTIDDSDYRQLKEGDVIPTHATLASLAEIWVDATPRFLAEVGQEGGRKAVKIRWLIQNEQAETGRAA